MEFYYRMLVLSVGVCFLARHAHGVAEDLIQARPEASQGEGEHLPRSPIDGEDISGMPRPVKFEHFDGKFFMMGNIIPHLVASSACSIY